MAAPAQQDDSSKSTPALVAPRVALFTGSYNHIADGVSLTLNRLVKHLEEQGAEVLIFAPTISNPPIQHNGTLVPVPSVSAPGRPEYRVSRGFPRHLQDQLKAFKPNLVHVATPDVLGYQAMRWAYRNDVPLVSSYHTHFASYLKYYGLSILEGTLWRYLRWFYRKCQQIYVPTPSMKAVLEANGITKGLLLWPRGVKTERFQPAKRSLEWRRDLGIEDDEVVVTFVSRLVWEKSLDVYADVIEGLEAQGLRHRALIVGDGPAREELAQRLTKALFVGYQKGDDLARAYASSDLFLFPSETETFGNVTLEAMASGLPCVCADATGSNALVRHNQTGFLAPPRESDTFLDYTARLVQHASLRTQMGKAARDRALEYDWTKILGLIPNYYNCVLNPDAGLPDAASFQPTALLQP